MAMAIPVIPVLPAGYVATVTDFNNLAYAATFLLGKPLARIHDGAGGQALAVAGTAIQYSVADFNNDSMWNNAFPTQLTVQTPGFYKIDYMIDQNSGITMNSVAKVTTGANNPAGAGITTACWPGYGSGASRVCPRASGVIPYFMYQLDYVRVFAFPNSAGATTVSASTFTPSYLVLELVSI